MNSILQGLSIIGLFLLRLAVPLAITFVIAYYLRRLDAKWEKELQKEKTQTEATTPSLATPVLQMSTNVTIPTAKDLFGVPCWRLHNCQQTRKEQCAAFQNPELPCWWARFRAEGHIPRQCYTCQIFVSWEYQPPDTFQPAQTPLSLH